MPSELEKDITEIKVSMARIEEKLKSFESGFARFVSIEERVRILEAYKAKASGYAAAMGAIAGFIAGILIKLL